MTPHDIATLAHELSYRQLASWEIDAAFETVRKAEAARWQVELDETRRELSAAQSMLAGGGL